MDQMSFPGYAFNNSYAMSPVPGFSFGNSAVDMLASMMIGQNAAPRPIYHSNQSMYDAYRMRDRNLEYLKIRELAFKNSFVSQRFFGGINTDSPVFKVMSPFLTDPDGMVMKGLSQLQGGNPVQAQMRLFAGLTGQTATAFGESGYASVPQTSRMMEEMFKQAYTFRTVREDYDPKAGFNVGNTISLNQYRQNLLNNAKGRLSGSQYSTMQGIVGGDIPGFIDRLSSAESQMGNSSNKDLASLLEHTQKDINDIRGNKSLESTAQDAQIEKLKSKAIESAEAFLKTFKDPSAKNKIADAFRDALDSGEAGTKRFASQYSPESGKMVEEMRKFGDMVAKLGRELPSGMNLQATRGFALEDISSAFIAAGDVRLLSGKKGYAQTMKDFMQPGAALSVMDAARGIYGNDVSGRDMVMQLSDLLGSSYQGLDDPNQARKLEDMLHGIKAAARTAGVTVESILGIIDQGKQLAQAHGVDLGGAYHISTAISAMNQSTVLGGFLSNQEVRRLGGTRGMALAANYGQNQAAFEPISQRLGVLSLMYQNDPEIQKQIAAFANGENGPLTRYNANQFFAGIAQQRGLNPYVLDQQLANSPNAAALGLKANPALANIAKQGYADQFDSMLVSAAGGADIAAALKRVAFGDEAGLDDEYKSIMSNPALSDAAKQKLINTYKARKASGSVLGLSTFVGVAQVSGMGLDAFAADVESKGYQPTIYSSINREIRERIRKQEIIHKQSVDTNREFQTKMGMFQSKPMQMMFNSLINGDMTRFGISPILDVFRSNDTGKQYTESYNILTKGADLNAYVNSKTEGLEKFYTELGGRDIKNLLGVGELVDSSGLRYLADLDESKQKAAYQEQINILKVRGETEKAKKLESIGLSGVLRAARTLQAIDPNNEFSEKLTEAGLFKDTLTHQVARKAILAGVESDRVKQSDELNTTLPIGDADLRVLLSGLDGYGVVENNKVNYKQIEKLQRQGGKAGKEFRDLLEATRTKMGKTGQENLAAGLEAYEKSSAEVEEQVNKAISGVKTVEQQQALLNAISELTSTLGGIFGGGKDGSLISSLTQIGTAIQEVGKR